MVPCLNSLVMLNTKSNVIMTVLNNNQGCSDMWLKSGELVKKLNLFVIHMSGHINFLRMVTIPYVSTKIIKYQSK
jgi:hypothetical protein